MRRPGVAPAKEERESTVAPITGGGWMTISWEEYLTKTLPKRYVKFVGGEDRGLTVKAWCTRVTQAWRAGGTQAEEGLPEDRTARRI